MYCWYMRDISCSTSNHYLPDEWLVQFKDYTATRTKPVHHDDVMTCKRFPHYWPFWAGNAKLDVLFALRLKKCWNNNPVAGDLKHYDVHVTWLWLLCKTLVAGHLGRLDRETKVCDTAHLPLTLRTRHWLMLKLQHRNSNEYSDRL